MEKECLECGKSFSKPVNESLKNWENRHKYCSRNCANLSLNLFIPERYKRECEFCGTVVHIIKARLSSFKYCSLECRNKSMVGKPTWNKGKKGLQVAWNKGIKRSWSSTGEFKKGDNLGVDHPRWKGSDASYISIHKWVAYHKGRPKSCEHCKEDGKDRYEWANIDGKYSRDLDAYIRLCKSCHTKFDINRSKAFIPA